MTIVDKLKIIKGLSGLTQEKMAKELGVSFVSFNRWINNISAPRKAAEKNINNLYFKYTGQRNVPDEPLEAKKEIIRNKSKAHKSILAIIMNNPDIYDQFLLSLTYNTNRIEGSTLTEDETGAILFDNITLPNRNVIEHLEVKNHQSALRFMLNYFSQSSYKIDEALILKLHSNLMNGIKSDAGSYRGHAVRIVGAYVPTVNYLKVPQLIKELIKNINGKDSDIISKVAKIHSRFEQIHPFSDGNGRIGRLIMTAMLLSNNFPPAIVKQEKKRFYNSCLRKGQLQEDFLPLEDFICDAVIEGIKIIERIG
ncbi:MAG: Fic family protein [Candidatus Parcubacteria bacterium]|nr:Fic family protein [Candidatus Parcubacteria bacterium]